MISRVTQEWLLKSWKDRVDARDREVEVTGIGPIGWLVNLSGWPLFMTVIPGLIWNKLNE